MLQISELMGISLTMRIQCKKQSKEGKAYRRTNLFEKKVLKFILKKEQMF